MDIKKEIIKAYSLISDEMERKVTVDIRYYDQASFAEVSARSLKDIIAENIIYGEGLLISKTFSVKEETSEEKLDDYFFNAFEYLYQNSYVSPGETGFTLLADDVKMFRQYRTLICTGSQYKLEVIGNEQQINRLVKMRDRLIYQTIVDVKPLAKKKIYNKKN